MTNDEIIAASPGFECLYVLLRLLEFVEMDHNITKVNRLPDRMTHMDDENAGSKEDGWYKLARQDVAFHSRMLDLTSCFLQILIPYEVLFR